MKLQAKHSFENVIDTTVGRTRRAGEVFEADEARAKVLLEHNLVYVLPEEKVEEIKEEIKEELKEEKKPRKKKK